MKTFIIATLKNNRTSLAGMAGFMLGYVLAKNWAKIAAFFTYLIQK